MFTGLVEAVGKIRSLRRGSTGAELVIEAPFEGLTLGESVAIEGVCLTVTALPSGAFTAQATAETLARTTLGGLAQGARVNLERSLALGARMGGHIVLGHVDGVGRIAAVDSIGDDAVRVSFTFPGELAAFFARKGSVAVDGVSLTVNGVDSSRFDVVLIPHTRKVTTLGDKRPGERVNLEVDVVARYVLRSLEVTGAGNPGGTLEELVRGGSGT